MAMTSTTILEPEVVLPIDPLAEAVADVAGLPEAPTAVVPEAERLGEVKTRELVIIDWSGDLDRIWPVLILSSTAAASGMRCKVFVTFWGLLPFVKDQKRVIGENWMQKMLS